MDQRSSRRRIAAVLAALGTLVALAAAAELAFLLVVSRPFFRTWLAAELARSRAGVFEFGRIGGNPLAVAVHDVTFTAEGPANIRRLRAPIAYATLEWKPLLAERRLAVHTLRLDDAFVEARLQGTASEQIALPLPARRVQLRRCTVRIADVSGWTIAIDGAEGTLDPAADAALTATLDAARASVEHLVLEQAEVRARLGDSRLDVERLAGRLYGGRLEARGTVVVGPLPALRDVAFQVSGVDVLPAFKSVWGSGHFAGKGGLDVTCAGRLTPTARDLSGRGQVRLDALSTRIDLPSWNLFNVAPTLTDLEHVLGLAGGGPLELSGARALLRDLAVENRDLKVIGTGFVGFDGGLAIDCRSYLRERLARGLPGFVRSSLERSPSGELIVPFRVRRTLADPKAEVDDVLKRALLRPFKKVFD